MHELFTPKSTAFIKAVICDLTDFQQPF